jgi:hypothetical protein
MTRKTRQLIAGPSHLRAKMQRLSQQPPVSFVRAKAQTQTARRIMLANMPSSSE